MPSSSTSTTMVQPSSSPSSSSDRDNRSRNVVAMERRMRALIRKAEPTLSSTRPELVSSQHFKEGLVQLLGSLVHNKREYTELFETPEATEAFAIKSGLSEPQTALLIAMQRNKDIFVPNPLLDAVCTGVFMAECLFIAVCLWKQNLLLVFLGLLFLCDCVTNRVKATSQAVGSFLSSWVHKRGFVDVDPLSGPVQMKKWQEQSWQLFSHCLFSCLEWRLLTTSEADGGGKEWFDDPARCWIPHPYDQPPLHSPALVSLYLAQLAVWVFTCLEHRWSDERRKDYFVMFLHHIVTIMLVAGSYSAGYLRIGLLVLWVHDTSDILVDALKMINYLKLEAAQGLFMSEFAYLSCVLGWCYWRLYRFPFTAIRGALVESFRVIAPQPRLSWEGALGIVVADMPLYLEMNALLLTLLALHCYWFWLFLMIGYRILTESAREASRQEYEGDSDDGETATPSSKKGSAAAGNPTALTNGGSSGSGPASNSGSKDRGEGGDSSNGGARQRRK